MKNSVDAQKSLASKMLISVIYFIMKIVQQYTYTEKEKKD